MGQEGRQHAARSRHQAGNVRKEEGENVREEEGGKKGNLVDAISAWTLLGCKLYKSELLMRARRESAPRFIYGENSNVMEGR